MHIIEKKIVAKTGKPETCEDSYCVTEHYACVIDGATNVSDKKYHGQTPGQIISEMIEETIPHLPPKADIGEIIAIINHRLINHYEELGIIDSIRENPFSRPSAALALYSRHRRTVWLIGDCQCMIDDDLHTNTKVVDDITAQARSLFLEAELQKGKTIDELLERDTGFEAVKPFIQMQYYMQNLQEDTQYSYIAVTGFDFNLSDIKTIPIKPNAEYLVLASDGYPQLKPTLDESETYLQYILENDPLCFREYKLAKGLVKGHVSFDDRTYLRINLRD